MGVMGGGHMNSGGALDGTGMGSAGARGMTRVGAGVRCGAGEGTGEVAGDAELERRRVAMRRRHLARRGAAVRAAGRLRERARGVGARGDFVALEPRGGCRVPCGSGDVGATVDGRTRSAERGGAPAGWSGTSPSNVAVAHVTATAASNNPRRRRRARPLLCRPGGAAVTLGVANQSGRAAIPRESRWASGLSLGSQALSGARNGLGGSLGGAAAADSWAGSVIALLLKRRERRNWPLRSASVLRASGELLGDGEPEALDGAACGSLECVECVGAAVEHGGQLVVVRDRDGAVQMLGAEAIFDHVDRG